MKWSSAANVLTVGLFVSVLGAVGCTHRGTTGTETERVTRPATDDRAMVDSQDIDRQPGRDIERALHGRIAGVVVSPSSDGGISVRIRGATSGHSSEPLYILDGLPIQPGPNGTLTGINPSDIESIRVLKDAADTAMYGSRGANGVIVIKTKRPVPKP
jgi:TonB-dependent SusC/RagA subfamily outer membrane receptor